MRRLLWLGLAVGLAAGAEVRLESNVIYGMYSGLALLLDVYHPEKPNGYGVVFISGSGWHAPLAWSARPLKESGQEEVYARPLAAAGYTVFAINHRAAPRFHYPAAVEDAQRAARFARHNARRFGIRPDRIGAVGGSSGGHLVLMLGLLDGKGDPEDPDPVSRESAKVQCVVARAAPADLAGMGPGGGGAPVSFLGVGPGRNADPKSVEARTFREASPVTHVSADDPPILLMHGDRDETVPFQQSENMEKALRGAGVTTRLLRVPGGGHGPTFAGAVNPPDYIGEMIRWLGEHLGGGA